MADGEKKWRQETVGRKGGDGGMAMTAVAAEDGGGGQ